MWHQWRQISECQWRNEKRNQKKGGSIVMKGISGISESRNNRRRKQRAHRARPKNKSGIWRQNIMAKMAA